MGLGNKTTGSTEVSDAAKKAMDNAAEEKAKEKDVADVKPADVKPADVKPADVKPADIKPADVKPADEEKAVAVKPTALPPATRQKVQGMVLSSLENALPPLDFGTLPRFKASPMGIKGEEGTLGSTCTVTIISFNNLFAVAPNTDGAPNDLCKFSVDGVTLSDGTGSVEDYLEELKIDWPKASAKRYVELVGILDDAEKDHEEIGNMVTFSLSPMSVKSFERYRLQATVKMGRNAQVTEEELSRVKITAKAKSFGKNDFTMLDFSEIK
jgi:hypothetical protein